MTTGVRLVVLGKQGAGKGTQCALLSQRYAVPHISTGDMLRAAVAAGSELGQQVAEVIASGSLVSDEIITAVVRERLSESDAMTRGFILDGYPRTVRQAELLEAIIADRPLDCVLDLEVPTDLVLSRLAGRLVCGDCAAIYSTDIPPVQVGVCDKCGGPVLPRKDDQKAEAIKARLDAYELETSPLVAYYTDQGLLEELDGTQSPDAVFESAKDAISRRQASKA